MNLSLAGYGMRRSASLNIPDVTAELVEPVEAIQRRETSGRQQPRPPSNFTPLRHST